MFQTKELVHTSKCGRRVSCYRLDIPKICSKNIFTKQLNMTRKESYDITTPELIILKNYSALVSTVPLLILLGAFLNFDISSFDTIIRKEMGTNVLPLILVKTDGVAVPTLRLGIAFEKSFIAPVMPLITRKKKMTKRQLMELFDDLDEFDE